MSFTARGLRLAKALENFAKEKPQFFDTRNIFNKIKIIAANDEILRASFTVDASMCNAAETLHGGYIASLMDIMCLYANIGRTNGRSGVTTTMDINFLKSAQKGNKLIAEAKTLNCGMSPVLEATIYEENGAIVAKSMISFSTHDENFQKLTADILKFEIKEKTK